MMSSIMYIGMVALCVASISYTICYTSIFKWLREWISPLHPKLEELIHCPYCFAHYVTLVVMFTTKNVSSYLIPITGLIWYDFLFTWFCIICVVSLLHSIMLIAYKPVIEFVTNRKIAQMQQKHKQ